MSAAIRIFSAQGNIPVLVDGTLARQSEGVAELLCDEGAAKLSPGSRVVLTIHGEAEKRTGTITALEAADGGRYTVSFEDGVRHSLDKRDFPRLHGGLPIGYRLADASLVARWLDGEAIDGSWTEPDPYMNFSVGGLQFEAAHKLDVGQLLLIKLRVGDAGPTFRASARVVRVLPAAPESDAKCRIAVSFESLPADAREALSDLTLQIQETLL